MRTTQIGWGPRDIPDQSGRTAVVTGASSGIGREVAAALARSGAEVVLASRSWRRAADDVAVTAGSDAVHGVTLDLESQSSVRAAAETIRSRCARVDLLVLNAGLMQVAYDLTEDGFERTLAVNHLGHFSLTGLVLDRLLAAEGSRVVVVSSLAHRRAADVGDLRAGHELSPSAAYARSKLANLLFAYELDRRLAGAGAPTAALAAHPGNARTGLWRTSSAIERATLSHRLRLFNSWIVQDPAQGALPVLRAAADPDARGDEYYGPAGRFEYTGPPGRVASSAASHDGVLQRQLWQTSEELTGVRYSIPARPSAQRP